MWKPRQWRAPRERGRRSPGPAPGALPLLGLAGVWALVLAGCENDSSVMRKVEEEAAASEASARTAVVEHPLPRLSVETVEGTAARVADRLGPRVTVVNFWATWCTPCADEMPRLVELSRRHVGRGLRLVAIAVDSPDTAAIRDWMDRYGMHDAAVAVLRMPHTTEPAAVTHHTGLPVTWIVGPDTVVRAALFGAQTYGAFRSAVSPYLD